MTSAAALARAPEHSVDPLFIERWSPRAFSGEEIPEATLMSLFEAARWAPSSYNEQPWRFICCPKDHPADHERFLSILAEGNVPWARHAPVLILSVANTQFTHNGIVTAAQIYPSDLRLCPQANQMLIYLI